MTERARGTWGERLRRLRDERGWTQGQLAHHAGVDQSQISRIENGAQDDVRKSTVEKLAGALRVPPDVLLGWATAPAAAPGLLAEVADDVRWVKDELRKLEAQRLLREQDEAEAARLARLAARAGRGGQRTGRPGGGPSVSTDKSHEAGRGRRPAYGSHDDLVAAAG